MEIDWCCLNFCACEEQSRISNNRLKVLPQDIQKNVYQMANAEEIQKAGAAKKRVYFVDAKKSKWKTNLKSKLIKDLIISYLSCFRWIESKNEIKWPYIAKPAVQTRLFRFLCQLTPPPPRQPRTWHYPLPGRFRPGWWHPPRGHGCWSLWSRSIGWCGRYR